MRVICEAIRATGDGQEKKGIQMWRQTDTYRCCVVHHEWQGEGRDGGYLYNETSVAPYGFVHDAHHDLVRDGTSHAYSDKERTLSRSACESAATANGSCVCNHVRSSSTPT